MKAVRDAVGPLVDAVPAANERFVSAVVHLAGKPIAARRWSAAQKAKITESRVTGTRRVVEAIARMPQKPRVLVSASADLQGGRGRAARQRRAVVPVGARGRRRGPHPFPLRDPRYRGPVNAVAPVAVTNREFTRIYATSLRRPAIAPPVSLRRPEDAAGLPAVT